VTDTSNIPTLCPETEPTTLMDREQRAVETSSLDGVCFLPWVGAEYERQEIRLLLLGESHHGDDPATWTTDPRRVTIECTQAYVDGSWRHKYWTNIMKVVEGTDYWEIDRKDFWSKVAFFNYIQKIVGEGPGIAPTEAMWREAVQGFGSVLRSLQPTHILVLSKRLWDHVITENNSVGPHFGETSDGREIRSVGLGGSGTAIATWLPHPSYHFHFNAKILHPVVHSFLDQRS
jgi:hypothetical protein